MSGGTAEPGRLAPLELTVVASGALGGAERWLCDLLDATDRLRPEAVLLESGPLGEQLRRRGVPLRRLEVGKGAASIARAALTLARLLRASRADVVLANGVKAACVGTPAAWAAGVPVVWAKHDFSYDSRLARPLGRAVDRLVSVSSAVAEATGREAVLVPPPLPPAPLPRGQARAELTRAGVALGDGPVLATVGRLVPYKGVDTAIRALALGPARDWSLVAIGDDDPSAPGERRRLGQLAHELEVGDRVALVGGLERAGRLLAAVDAVCVLTRMDASGFGREGFSMVALEALRAGVPLIGALDSPEVARLARAGGEVVAPDDSSALAAALGRVREAAARERARRAGEQLALTHPDASACAALLAATLAEAARRPGAGLSPSRPLSVVTTVRDEERAVGPLLDALLAQARDQDEILVVDGGSRDGTPAQARARADRDGRVRLLDAPGANISAGRNIGIAAARHPIVACTDAGCLPAPGWLDALRVGFQEPRAADLITGVYRVAARTAMERAMVVACYPDPAEARRAGPLVRVYTGVLGRGFDPSMPTGRSVAFSTDAWRAVGGFPEQLAAGEDVTFGRAIVRAGGRAALARDAEVLWTPRPTMSATARMYFRYGVGGGLGGDRLVLGRDLARAAAYLAAPALLSSRAGRAALLVGSAAYLSLPLARVARDRLGVGVLARIPVALAVKDLAKAAGALSGLAQAARLGGFRTPPAPGPAVEARLGVSGR